MKKILLVLRHTEEEFAHDVKYIGIIKALQNQKFDVYYTNVNDNEVVLIHNDERKIIKGGLGIGVNRNDRNMVLYKAISKLFESDFTCDYAYIRAIPACWGFVKMVKGMRSNGTEIIVEIPTYPAKKEQKSDKRLSRKFIYAYMNFFEKLSAKHISLYALIGEQDDQYLGRPAINIDNGINIENIDVRVPKGNPEEIHILCLAKMARWHGYDRIIKGLYEYYQTAGNKNVYIEMVGPDGDGSLKEWQDLTERLKLQDYVSFHGAKFGSELSDMFNQCDIACDSLGCYVKNFNACSSLKIREYTARGIPFILTINDNLIDESLPFWKRFEDNSNNIDMKSVIDFVEETRKISNLPQKMNDYAKENMTWERQLQILFDKLNSL